MAATVSVEQDQFCCSVCLEVLRDPVTIPCGHSYCLECIEDYWNRPKQKGHYTCPQCRQVFNPRPALSRNTVLGEVAAKFQQTGFQTAAQHKAEEVKCSVCTRKKSKAVRSCAVCLDALCAAHLRAHEEKFAGKAHRLIPAADLLQACEQHHRLLRLYCHSDQQCVCSQCVRGAHKGHDTVPVQDERAIQQKKLQEASLKSAQKMKDAEKELRYIIRYIKHSAEAAVEESERLFSKLIHSIEKRSCELKEQIRVQQMEAVSQAEELLENIQREVTEIRRREAELEQLSQTEDHVHFLQKCKFLHFHSKSVEMPSTDALPYLMYKSIRGAVADLREGLEETLEKEFHRISDKEMSLKEVGQSAPEKMTVKDAEIPVSSEPKTRAGFLYYYCDITLDPNTANSFLCLSDGRRAVTTGSEPQSYPDHPERFSSWAQVLGRAGLAGRCYWEVEWSGSGGVSIGVCYKNMSRTGGGSDAKLGHNSKSWSLDCSSSVYSFQHNKQSVALAGPCGGRIGVYLDFRGGTVSFYAISDRMILLHKAKAAFTHPLYPGFWVGLGSTLKLSILKTAN